jgi:hypothetical protein
MQHDEQLQLCVGKRDLQSDEDSQHHEPQRHSAQQIKAITPSMNASSSSVNAADVALAASATPLPPAIVADDPVTPPVLDVLPLPTLTKRQQKSTKFRPLSSRRHLKRPSSFVRKAGS